MKLRTLAAWAIVASGLALAAGSAQAVPVSVPGPNFDNTLVQDAAYGCGPGWTRGPYGHCRPKYTCPRGFHPGPEGLHCVRNVHPYRPYVYHPYRRYYWHY